MFEDNEQLVAVELASLAGVKIRLGTKHAKRNLWTRTASPPRFTGR